MAKPDEPLERVTYTKMVLNSNPTEHLVTELKKAYAYIDELEQRLAVVPEPEPVNRNPDADPNLDPDLKRPELAMIQIFVGCSGNDEDLEFQAVVHYSLEQHASQPLEHHMDEAVARSG